MKNIVPAKARELARLYFKLIEQWGAAPDSIATSMVNRAFDGRPYDSDLNPRFTHEVWAQRTIINWEGTKITIFFPLRSPDIHFLAEGPDAERRVNEAVELLCRAAALMLLTRPTLEEMF